MENTTLKKGKLRLRKTQRGFTLVTAVSTNRRLIIDEVEKVSFRDDKSAAKILGDFIERAFDAGIPLDPELEC